MGWIVMTIFLCFTANHLIYLFACSGLVVCQSLEMGSQPHVSGTSAADPPLSFPAKRLYSIVEMPGSELVVDPAQLFGDLVNCSATLCPYGKVSVLEFVNITTARVSNACISFMRSQAWN